MMLDRFRDILDALPDGMILVDREGSVLLVNVEAERLFGRGREEMLGQPLEALVPERLRTRHVAERERYVRAPSVRAMGARRELYGLRPDGSEFPVEVSLSPLRLAEGEVVLAAIRDVSERKKVESRLLASDRLASVGTLAAGVVHEINNPLGYVSSNLDLIAEGLRDLAGADPAGLSELLTLADDARDGVDRIRRIVRGLQTYSRLDDARPRPLDVARVLESAITVSANELRHRARILRRYGPAPLVEADEVRLGQVFINLLVNAAQALPEARAGRHEIRLITATAADGRALVEVRDTGAGIPPEVLPRIFDPFFTTKAVGVGTGLGLSICQGIIASMGGEIRVESEVGVGTAVRVYLPPAEERAEEHPSQPPEETAASPRGRVLVIDDEPLIRSSLGRVLREHEVTLAAGSREALALLRGGAAFDVILCDLMMPDLSGAELHAELLALDPALAPRIIFLTGGAFTEAARAFLAAVPNDTLEKPVDTQALRALVRQRLR